MDGGVINPNWVDVERRGAAYCQQLLSEQGVRFDESGRANPSQRVACRDELRRPDESEPVA